MAQAFYREYRPRKWEQVVGQDPIVHTLQNIIRSNRIGHAYLFAGPRGTGKTSTARLLAKAVNCLDVNLANRPCDQCAHCMAVNENRFLDLVEIDAASNTSVDDVRDLRDKINFSPTQGTFKIYIIDEVHMLSTAAFNALLKTLEEPPAHAIFILATTEIHKIPATVLSRCQRYEFRRIPVKDIIAHLQYIIREEEMIVEPEALPLIARQATGSLRDAISLLDQLTSTGEFVTLSMVQLVLGTATSQNVIDLVEAILKADPAVGLQCIHGALDGGTDARQFARQVVDYLRSLLLVRMGGADQVDTTQEIRAQMAKQAQAFNIPSLLEAIRLFNQAANEGRMGWQPGLMLELAFAGVIESGMHTSAVIHETQRGSNAHKNIDQQEIHPLITPTPNPKQGLAQTQTKAGAGEFSSSMANSPPEPPSPPPFTASQATAPSTPIIAPPSSDSLPTQQVPQNPTPSTTIPPDEGHAAAFQTIQKNWEQIKAAVRKTKPATTALLNSCKPLGIKNTVLVLCFSSDVVKSKMESVENIEMTRQAITDVTGLSLQVKCIVNPKASALPPDLDIDSDGMVNEALNLGGKIVGKS